MPIHYCVGDVTKAFDNYIGDKILVHGCNSQGVMGLGIAKQIKVKYPEAFAAYKRKFDSKGLTLGENVYADLSDGVVCNAITQKFYGKDGKRYASLESIKRCMRSILVDYPNYTIFMPMIGCGLGGLQDAELFDTLAEVFEGSAEVFVYKL